jgi:hypothetical protein
VLSGRDLCDGLITCPEESYRVWCVVVCDREVSERAKELLVQENKIKEWTRCILSLST